MVFCSLSPRIRTQLIWSPQQNIRMLVREDRAHIIFKINKAVFPKCSEHPRYYYKILNSQWVT